MINFTKMHGTGNDYIFIDARKKQILKPEKLSIKMSSRHTGVGSDGIILILNSEIADFKMRMFNSDGSEAEMCGNGIRCFGKFVYDRKFTDKKEITIETLAGIKHLKLMLKSGKINQVIVNMGTPILRRELIPMIGKQSLVINETIPLVDGSSFEVTAVSMGNPHIVIFVEDVEKFPVEKYGPLLENHELFPQRTNVEFVQVLNNKEVIQRTWERGAGETFACGTGASAVTVAGSLTGHTEKEITIHLKGGDLHTLWNEKDDSVYLTGAAVEVFTGVWPE
jgi:diaminopimelate epimerase